MTVALPDRLAGRPCLDLANTVDPRHDPATRREYLTSYDAVLAWARQGGVLPEADLDELAARAARDPSAARAALGLVLAAREAVYAVVAAARAGQPPPAPELDELNAVLRVATAHHVLVPAAGRGVVDAWTGTTDDLGAPLWPVALDAWDLLTVGDLARVRECPGDGTCGWLFVDTSRSGTRRWCDMRTCGNRAKVRTHYRRLRDGVVRAPG